MSTNPPETNEEPTEFYLTLSRPAMDQLLTDAGVVPTQEVRETVKNDLFEGGPVWITNIVYHRALRILEGN